MPYTNTSITIFQPLQLYVDYFILFCLFIVYILYTVAYSITTITRRHVTRSIASGVAFH